MLIFGGVRVCYPFRRDDLDSACFAYLTDCEFDVYDKAMVVYMLSRGLNIEVCRLRVILVSSNSKLAGSFTVSMFPNGMNSLQLREYILVFSVVTSIIKQYYKCG